MTAPDPYQQQSQHPQQGYQPQGLGPKEERNLGMLSHIIPLAAMILSAGFLGFVASLVVYLMYKDRGRFVATHAANSLNVQITMGIVMLISLPLMLVLIGFVTFGLAIAVAAVLHIVGAVKASNGEFWNPPLTLRIVS